MHDRGFDAGRVAYPTTSPTHQRQRSKSEEEMGAKEAWEGRFYCRGAVLAGESNTIGPGPDLEHRAMPSCIERKTALGWKELRPAVSPSTFESTTAQ